MKLPFLDRREELARLADALRSKAPILAVLYGRRRCGKSTLLQRILRAGDVYHLADQREPALQIESLAATIDTVLPGFAAARYPSWESLIRSLSGRSGRRWGLFLDEFPYLVQTSPELPSLIQKEFDRPGPKGVDWILCGSSQRMMQGIALERTAPLYGRAAQIIRVGPLAPGWIQKALGMTGAQAVEAYAVWGGVPRYWELAADYKTTLQAVRELVLHRHGVLHDEPQRLLLDDMRSAVQAYSVMILVASGCHRISEIGARLGKPAGSLTRLLGLLIELGLVRRDVPWGETERSTKRTLYRIDDPFLRLHCRFVEPHHALLEMGNTDVVFHHLREGFAGHAAGVWEDLARQSVPLLKLAGVDWGQACRWWGTGIDGHPLEVDVVAESLDHRSLLVGEVKWTGSLGTGRRQAETLHERARRLPFARGRTIVHAAWLRRSEGIMAGVHILTPEKVLASLSK